MLRLTIRRLILAGLLCLPGLTATTPAKADIWCLRSFDSSPPGTCVFSRLDDCVRAASVGAFGGRCERQAFAPRASSDKRRTERKRPSERPQQWQQWW